MINRVSQSQQGFMAEQESAACESRHPIANAIADTVDGTAHLVAAAGLATAAISASGAEAATTGAQSLAASAARGLARFARWLGHDTGVSPREAQAHPAAQLWHQAGEQLGAAADDFAHVAEAGANALAPTTAL